VRGYYFITDTALSLAGNVSDVRQAVAAGVEIVQYREKSLSTKAMYEEALLLKQACHSGSGKVLFVINDRIDIALAVNADGVHIGQTDLPYEQARELLGPAKIIGVTVHTVDQALLFAGKGADYLGVSPIYSTHTKSDAGTPCGPDLIRQIKRVVNLPLVAIGGINFTNAQEVIAAGADGLCAISAVVTRDDVKKEILKFKEMFI
jgi:thiamine-phosphate pyrophosphorylase